MTPCRPAGLRDPAPPRSSIPILALLLSLLLPATTGATPPLLPTDELEQGRELRQQALEAAWEAHPREALPAPPDEWLEIGDDAVHVERDQARELFFEGEWAELERRAADLRTFGDELPNGMPRLQMFYRGLSPHNWEGPHLDHDRILRFKRQADLWREQRGGSITQLVASLKVDRAILNQRPDREAEQRFRDTMLAIMDHPDPCPEWYADAVWYAGYERDEAAVLRWFNQGRELHPTYVELYLETARALGRRVQWSAEQIELLASTTLDDPVTRDLGIYHRMLANSTNLASGLASGDILWPRFRADAVRHLHRYPRSVTRWNYFTRMACFARDRADAAIGFAVLGRHTPLEHWQGMEGQAEIWRAWALAGPDDPTRPAADALASTIDLTDGWPVAMEFHPDPEQPLLVVGTSRRQLLLHRMPDGEPVALLDLSDLTRDFAGSLSVFRWSDDGRRLAVGIAPGSARAADSTGGLVLIDWDSANADLVVTELLEFRHGVAGLAFVDDDRRLLVSPQLTIVTNRHRSNPPALLDLDTLTWQYSGRREVRLHNGSTFAASRRGGWVVFANQDPFLMRLPDGAPDLLPPPAGQGGPLPGMRGGYHGWNVDLDREGSLLAVGYSKSGGVTEALHGLVRVFRVPDLAPPFDLEPPYPYGNTRSVRFSDDGAWLAAATVDGGAHVWCVETGECLRSWIAEPFLHNRLVCISPCRRWLLTMSDPRRFAEVRVWSATALGLEPAVAE